MGELWNALWPDDRDDPELQKTHAVARVQVRQALRLAELLEQKAVQIKARI